MLYLHVIQLHFTLQQCSISCAGLHDTHSDLRYAGRSRDVLRYRWQTTCLIMGSTLSFTFLSRENHVSSKRKTVTRVTEKACNMLANRSVRLL